MPLTESERKHYEGKFLVLRKGLNTLEQELGINVPVPAKGKKSFRQHLEDTYTIRSWRKPDELKKRNKKAAATTTAKN